MTEADVDSPGERSESLVLSQVRVRSTGLQPGEGYHEPRDSDSHVEEGLARDLSSFSVSELQEAFAFCIPASLLGMLSHTTGLCPLWMCEGVGQFSGFFMSPRCPPHEW